MFILSPLISDQFYSFLTPMNGREYHERYRVGVLRFHQNEHKCIDRLHDVLRVRQGFNCLHSAEAQVKSTLFPALLIGNRGTNVGMKKREHVGKFGCRQSHEHVHWNVAVSIVLEDMRKNRPTGSQSLAEYVGLLGQRKPMALAIGPARMNALANIGRNPRPRIGIVGRLLLRAPAPDGIE